MCKIGDIIHIVGSDDENVIDFADLEDEAGFDVDLSDEDIEQLDTAKTMVTRMTTRMSKMPRNRITTSPEKHARIKHVPVKRNAILPANVTETVIVQWQKEREEPSLPVQSLLGV